MKHNNFTRLVYIDVKFGLTLNVGTQIKDTEDIWR
jgi:hypothetical protein